MNELFVGMAILVIAFAVFVLLWWLLITTEGVYLGRRTVIFLYDLYARRYDGIKDYNTEYERLLLANPIMGYIAPHQSPLVLDVATGTGRLPLALLEHAHFHGQVIGADLSLRMLQSGAEKLNSYNGRASLIWGPAEKLPFEDKSFDVVTCLESLEFMIDIPTVVSELVRVLRPGGLLLITNRIGTKLMPGKIFDSETISKLLLDYGISDVEIQLWQEDYHRVWAMKDGDSTPVGARPLLEILRCPICGAAFDLLSENQWVCAGDHRADITPEGILKLFPLYAQKSV